MKPRHLILVSEPFWTAETLPASSWWLPPVAENCQLWVTFHSLLPPALCLSTCLCSVTLPWPFPHLNPWSVSKLMPFCTWLPPSCPPCLNSKITSSHISSLSAQSRKVLFMFSLSKYRVSFVALTTLVLTLKFVYLIDFLAGCQTLWLGCKLPEGRGCVRLPGLYT